MSGDHPSAAGDADNGATQPYGSTLETLTIKIPK
jgi:hypothetical protein